MPTRACTTARRCAALRDRYDAINIKLDKTGGLTEALALADAGRALGFDIMVGCMVSTSLSMAPAIVVAQQARVVDLDGPLLLAKDRETVCATTAASCIRRRGLVGLAGDEIDAARGVMPGQAHGCPVRF